MPTAGVVRVALLALIWGSSFLLIKVSLRGFTPVQLTFARLALGALVLGVILAVRQMRLPQGRALWLHLVVAAALANAIPYTLFGIAEQEIDSNLAGALNATTPLWTLVVALLARTQKRLTGTTIAGMLLGFAGALVILSPWDARGSLSGALICLAAAASYGASYVYMGRYLTNRGLPPLALSAAQLIPASGLLLLASPFGGFTSPAWRLDAVLAVLVLGAVGTGLAYALNYRIISDDGPLLASTVTYLLPVVSVILGALVLDEPITFRLAVGVLIVLAGVAITRRGNRPAQTPGEHHRVRTAE